MGRYLQPEPYLQNPWFVQGRAAAGMSTPVYAYAQNNPVTGFDENGLADRKECPVKKGTIVISELGTSCGGTCMVSNFDKLTEDEKCKE